MKRRTVNLWPLAMVLTFGLSVALVGFAAGWLWVRFGHLVVWLLDALRTLAGGAA